MEYHGEKVSQLEHALQTAQQAVDAGGSEEEIVAALLHDIGHIWLDADSVVTSVGVVEHDRIGSEVLRSLGFSAGVAQIVAGHVAAKRYLVANDEEYASKLSEASVESLRLQGGPMSPEESSMFSQVPWSAEKIRVRVWDDQAKTPEDPGISPGNIPRPPAEPPAETRTTTSVERQNTPLPLMLSTRHMLSGFPRVISA